MNNVNPPSSFTAHILLHTYTQECSQSSAESGFGLSASQHFGTLRLTPPYVRGVTVRPPGRTRVGAEPGKLRPGFLGLLPFALALAAGLLEIVDDRGVGEGRCVAKVVLALGHAAEDAAHDLAASRLRQVGGEDDLLDELVGSLSVALQNHVGHDSLALILVEPPDNGGLGHGLVGDERAFDLHGTDAVTRDVHHVVYPARDGVVTILIPLGSVLDEVLVAEPLPIGLAVTLGILVDRAEHARPRPGDDQVPLSGAFDRVIVLVVDVDEDTGEGSGGAARLGWSDAGERRDHDAAGLRLPPRIHDGAPSAADVLVVPLPCPRVDGFAYSTKQPQGREVVFLDGFRALLHERPDDGRRRVVDCHPVTLDHVPVPIRAGVARRTLELDGGRPVAQGPVHEEGVPCDPADVGLAPVDVVLFEVEDPFGRGLDLREVAACSVNDALGLARRA